jgi:hypothetical protein
VAGPGAASRVAAFGVAAFGVAAFGVAAFASAGCSSPQSFVVLVLESSTATPLTGVERLTVAVSKGTTQMKTLTYGASDLTLVADADLRTGTLSVSFSSGETGDITFQVDAFDAQGCRIGDGNVPATIIKGATSEVIVVLAAASDCPADGGEPDAGDAGGFGGCNLVHPQCAVPGQTCQVDCTTKLNACMTGGAVPAGHSCASAADCAPGSQCFDYSNVGCVGTKICLPFCDVNMDCSAFGSGGAGPGSFCRDPVACPGLSTPSHTCTFNCDPTASAAGSSGSECPSGLSCLLQAMDAVDCSCAEATRTGREGAACTSAASCAPGLLCSAQGGMQTCRSICRCDAQGGSCTAPSDCPTANTHCTVVTNQTIYGICL